MFRCVSALFVEILLPDKAKNPHQDLQGISGQELPSDVLSSLHKLRI